MGFVVKIVLLDRFVILKNISRNVQLGLSARLLRLKLESIKMPKVFNFALKIFTSKIFKKSTIGLRFVPIA